MKKLLIFDMDGVILDSEPVHERIEQEILRSFGMDRVDLSGTEGTSSYEMWKHFIDKYHMDSTPEALMERQYAGVLSYIKGSGMQVSDGFMELLQSAKGHGMKLAVASSSDSVLVYGVLEHYGIRDRFDAVVCGDHVPAKKPAPYIYEEVLRQVGVAAKEALTIEDSSTGSEAARRAGIDCVGYRNPTSGKQDLSNTWKQVDSMREVMLILKKVFD